MRAARRRFATSDGSAVVVAPGFVVAAGKAESSSVAGLIERMRCRKDFVFQCIDTCRMICAEQCANRAKRENCARWRKIGVRSRGSCSAGRGGPSVPINQGKPPRPVGHAARKSMLPGHPALSFRRDHSASGQRGPRRIERRRRAITITRLPSTLGRSRWENKPSHASIPGHHEKPGSHFGRTRHAASVARPWR